MDTLRFKTKIFHFYNRDSDGSILHINKQIQDIEIQTRYIAKFQGRMQWSSQCLSCMKVWCNTTKKRIVVLLQSVSMAKTVSLPQHKQQSWFLCSLPAYIKYFYGVNYRKCWVIYIQTWRKFLRAQRKARV